MLEFDPVDLARLQFAITALYHFLFVPLTLGLSFVLAIMESVYVMTGREIWRDMTRFLGEIVRHQFRHGGRHRHHHGISVRHQLGLLLALCRRHIRRAAGDRRPYGLLPGSDLRRLVFLRLGPVVEARPSDGDVAGGDRLEPLGSMDTRRQRMDAESGWRSLQPGHHEDGADLVLGPDF